MTTMTTTATAAAAARAYRFIEQAGGSYRPDCRSARPSRNGRPLAFTLNAIINRENLVRVFKSRRNQSGPCPGIDGHSFSGFSVTEFAEAAAVTVEKIIADFGGTTIREACWRPRPARVKSVPKDSGEPRPIDIRCVVDRMVSAAVADEVAARIDPLLAAGCYGFRPGRCVHGLLAEVAYRAEAEGLTVICQDDISNAFPSININHAMEDYSLHVIDPGLLRLIEVILRGNNSSRQLGIDQGDPLSPVTLNQRLHYCLNSPTSTSTDPGDTHRYWYADNRIYQSRRVTEGLRALQHDRALLGQDGFQLKGKGNYPVDLRRKGASIEVLGTTLCWRNDRVEFGLGNKAYRRLATTLERVHRVPDPSAVAKHVILGWVEAHGPTFESGGISDILDCVYRVAAQKGFREIGNRQQLQDAVRDALHHWTQTRESVVQRLQQRDSP